MCIVIEGWSSRTIHKVNQARGIEDKIALYTFGGGAEVALLFCLLGFHCESELKVFFPTVERLDIWRVLDDNI